ncbi:MAG: sigma-54-dependent Fis family transcriptional regulator [Planctomycetes bacterium]|nr:sigma-54-dependent Fis family transcriptional regulator [Planctomycetota bacterium]
MPDRILICDDEESLRWALQSLLVAEGFQVRTAHDVSSAIEAIEREPFDLVLTDLRMVNELGETSDTAGESVIRYIALNYPATPTIVLSARQTSQSAAAAMKAGAVDYLDKPFQRSQVLERVRSVLQKAHAPTATSKRLLQSLPERLCARSRAMAPIVEILARVSPLDINVFIAGASGTGKEFVARTIHDGSPRAGARFIALHCASLTENLALAELCGVEKGAFSGADRVRRGLFEECAGGTLLLDAVEELPYSVQGQIVQAIESREMRRVGSSRVLPVTTRILSSSGVDLRKRVSAGTFRYDLYSALRVVSVELPTLRERQDDLEPLVARFLQELSLEFSRKLTVSKEALELLGRHEFPGNLRELRNALRAAGSLATDGEISGQLVRERILPSFGSPPPSPVRESIQSVEAARIREALERNPGDLRNAAGELGISRTTLWRKMQRYGLRDRESNPLAGR